jgi:hypothetical protein
MFDRFVRLGAYRPGSVLAAHAALSLFFAAQVVEFRRRGIDQEITGEEWGPRGPITRI